MGNFVKIEVGNKCSGSVQCVIRMDGPTDGWTYLHSYRDARTDLKSPFESFESFKSACESKLGIRFLTAYTHFL